MRKRMIRRPCMLGITGIVLGAILLGGCGLGKNAAEATTEQRKASRIAGAIMLSVNPEIEVEYDEKGMVVEVEGRNEEGKHITGEYTGFEGKECDAVINELVEKIYEAGYLSQTVGGHEKNIVIKLEEGSSYPDDDFLEKVAQGVRDTVGKFGGSSVPMTVDEEDIGEDGYIGLDKAKELVLAQLGLNEAEFTEREYELDDGVYELEFTSGGKKYEFEVHGVTGKVLEADYEGNEDWGDDRDDREDDDREDADDRDDREDDDREDADDRDDREDDDREDADDRDDREDDDREDADDRDDREDDDREDADDRDDREDDDREDADDRDDREDDDREDADDGDDREDDDADDPDDD